MSAVGSAGFHSPSDRRAANAASLVPLSSLAYQSRAVAPFSNADLQHLVNSAQTRNRKEGVTGLLIYDQGRFLHWLEGPAEGLGRVWQSICNDRRHVDVSVIAQTTAPVRTFGGSAMALGKRREGIGNEGDREGKCDSALALPSEMIEKMHQSPQQALAVLAGLAQRPAEPERPHTGALVRSEQMSLLALVDDVLIPELLAKHARPAKAPFVPVIIDPHAAELARLLVATEPRAAFDLIDTLRADGRSMAQICAGLFEPAARALGDLWMSDDCSELEVTLGLGHLQGALRRVSFDTASDDVPRLPASVPHAVLVVPAPCEPHLLSSVISSEMFWRAGWDVRCEFPESDTALNRLVHERWFDVLELSFSGAFEREHRMSAMAASIRSAHAHSLNPALTVIVDGRLFHDRPQAFAEVGADAGGASAQCLFAVARAQFQWRHQPEAAGRPATATGMRQRL